jgi:hypothetical protein
MACLLVVGAGAVAVYAYSGLIRPLSIGRRSALVGLRFLALVLLLLGLAEPVRLAPAPPRWSQFCLTGRAAWLSAMPTARRDWLRR